MSEIAKRKRNLHTSIAPDALRIAQIVSAIEGRFLGEIVEHAIVRQYGHLPGAFTAGSAKRGSRGVR